MDNFFALIVGVGGTDIPETIEDAKAIRDVLITEGAYNKDNTFFLTAGESTKDNIISAFDKIIQLSKKAPDSTVFIYYSGHGQRFPAPTGKAFDYYLITHGADTDNKEETMLNGDIFSEKIAEIRANRVLVMLDCCYAGGIKQEEVKKKRAFKVKGRGAVNYSNRALQEKLKSGKGRVFVSSCDDNETSVILPEAENSLFTAVALEVLNGLFSQNREYVSVLDLIYHVLNEVPKRIQPYEHAQNPILTEAKNLNHQYYVCKNAGWKQRNATIDENLKYLDIAAGHHAAEHGAYEDLSDEDQHVVDNFIEKMCLDDGVQPEFKTDLINSMGGLKNLKITNKGFRPLKPKGGPMIQHTDTESLLNMVDEQIDAQTKLAFIKNYQHKI